MRKPPVVILAGVRWGFLWQRHQALATLFARAGYPTVFVETTGLSNPRPGPATLCKISSRLRSAGGEAAPGTDGLKVYAPLVAPPVGRASRWLNGKLLVPRAVRDLEKILPDSPVVVAYPPTRTTLDLIRGLDPRLVFYDCADDYARFPGAPKDINDTERELLRRADLVSCTSTPLLEKVTPLRPDAFLSGPAVDYERFAALQKADSDERASPVRTVCFFGHLGRERVDYRALRAVAAAGFVVRLVGDPGRAEGGFLRAPGVDYRGEVAHAELPAALAGVDAFVLPYKLNGLTQAVSPAKTFECLATGLPVVAAPLPAMRELADHVHLAQTPEDYVRVLRNLGRTETGEKARARTRLARDNSWPARFAQIEAALQKALRVKALRAAP